MNERTSREIQTIMNMFRVVDVLVDHDGAQVTEISSELGLAKSTVEGSICTLLRFRTSPWESTRAT